MARPKDADPARSRASILDAAEEEFAQRGFAGARMTAIAKRAGLNHAMLHYYFETKDKLYESVVERLFGRHLELLQAKLGSVDSGAALKETVLGSFELFWKHPNQVRIMLWEMASGDDRVERFAKPFFDALSTALPPLNPHSHANGCHTHDLRDVYTTLLGALVVYFFRDPSLKALFGEARFSDEDFARRRAHLGALLELFF